MIFPSGAFPLSFFRPPGPVRRVQRIPAGVELELGDTTPEKIRVEIIRDDIVRIKISKGGSFDFKPTHAVCADLSESNSTAVEIREDSSKVVVTTQQMSVTAHFDPFYLEAHRKDGSLIFTSPKDEEGKPWFYRALNDQFMIGRVGNPNDGIYGLGEKTGGLNKNGRCWTLWNSDVLNPNVAGGYREEPADDPLKDPTSTQFDPYYVSIPFYYHRPEGSCQLSGFFLDNSYRGFYDFSGNGESTIRFEGGQYTEYVFAGPRMDDILQTYTWLTGRIPAPPIWALGNHQCRWHDYNQKQIEELAQRIRTEKIPCDVLWLDIDYMDGYRVFTWDKKRFPDPAALFRHLEQKNFRVITIIDPGVKFEAGYPVFDEALRRNLLCRTEEGEVYVGQVWPGRTAFPDFAKEETRKWWGKLNAEHVRSGVCGIWNDMNEPATGDVSESWMCFNGGKSSHAKYHNQYAILMAMGTVEGLRQAMPDKRTFVLSRAGSAGIQRYAANWLGDNISRWDHLWMSIPMALGMGISGQPFVGADVGGFMGKCTPELLVRWHQYGALTPFCRNHNSTGQPDQYAWAFDDETKRFCREAIEMRYRLMPFLYAQFMLATETGIPVQRPLMFEFPEDPVAWGIDDQFLLGAHLMVAPVYQAGCEQRSVYLPRGTWYPWMNGGRAIKPGKITLETPLDRIPVLARGGAVIPCWTEVPDSTMGYQPSTVELNIFVPEEDGKTISWLHEDDGLTFAYQKRAYVRTNFQVVRSGGDLKITATVTGNGFAEFRRNSFRLRFFGLPGSEVVLNGRKVDLQDGAVEIVNRGEGFELQARIVESPAAPSHSDRVPAKPAVVS